MLPPRLDGRIGVEAVAQGASGSGLLSTGADGGGAFDTTGAGAGGDGAVLAPGAESSVPLPGAVPGSAGSAGSGSGVSVP